MLNTSTLDLDETEQFKAKLTEWQGQINARLDQISGSSKPSILYQPIQYVLDGGGKRIRPILLMLSCEAFGGNIDSCWDAAVAVELLHNFTLVHDDIMDQDDTRRGRPTVHKKWNADIALLAGDGLLALAYQYLLRTHSARIHEIAQIFTDGIIELCEGQAMDHEFETRKDVQLSDYLLMISKKTARLLNISTRIGSIIGGGNAQEIHVLGEFGYNIGFAFQIQDDLLDITSDQETLGKTFGSDIIRRKQTYLLIHAMNHGDAQAKKELLEILDNTIIQNSQIMAVRDIFNKTGTIDAAKVAIDNYISTAHKNLQELQNTQGKEELLCLLRYLSKRRT